jgi:hypothetical protein
MSPLFPILKTWPAKYFFALLRRLALEWLDDRQRGTTAMKRLSLWSLMVAVASCHAHGHEHACQGGKGAEESSISLFFAPEVTPTSVARPPIITRTAWGCPDGQSSRWTPQYTTVTHLIVHHSATANSSSDWAAVVRGIWNYHTFTQGWGDIGYNYLIDPNGVVYEGRGGGDNVIGAHFSCQNGGTMGVCLLGSFTNVSPTPSALNGLKQLLAWKAEQRGLDPLGSSYHSGTRLTIPNISGHRHGNPAYPDRACTSTTCPGDNLYAQLPAIRSDVKSIITALTVPTVQVRSATSITASSARIWGRVITNGGAAITERRLEWGISNAWSGFTSNVIVSGSDFYYDLTGLTPGALYQVRAWARNAVGWNSNGPAFFFTSIVPPRLRMTRAGSTVVLAWTNSADFTLEEAGGLSGWSAASPLPVLTNGENRVTNTISGPRRFYRLQRP